MTNTYTIKIEIVEYCPIDKQARTMKQKTVEFHKASDALQEFDYLASKITD